MQTKILNTALLLFLGMFINSCLKDQNPVKTAFPNSNNGVITKITLQNQSDHFGILVKLIELDTLTITDSTGMFSFENLADGEYTLTAGYPYFSPVQDSIKVVGGTIQTPVNIELQQQLQFWIEPPETTISLSNSSLFFFRQFAVNITDTIVNVGGYSGPPDFKAYNPQGFNWPFIPNPDSTINFCQFRYGTFRRGYTTDAPQFTFMPGDTIIGGISSRFNTDCFLTGTYLFFSAVTDLSRYPEYFDPDFFLNTGDPLKVIYLQMNRSVFRKNELFSPATIYVIE